MLIPMELTDSYRTLLGSLQSDLAASVREVVAGVSTAELPSALATILDPYMELGSMTAATFFEEMREYQGGSGRYTAQTLAGSEAPRARALTGYALAGKGAESPTLQAVASTIIGGASRILTERVNDTVIGNAQADVAISWKYQRVPRPNCCAFCGMLASRGAVYTSEAEAGSVVGAGTPIPQDGKRRRGGQAKGIKPRGSRNLGESYHDNCYCTVVSVMNGNGVQLSNEDRDSAQGHWFNVYERAKVEAGEDYHPEFEVSKSSDGSLIKTWHWVDSKGNKFKSDGVTDRIVNAMRREQYADEKDPA